MAIERKNSDLNKQKILVTGASGHLGLNLCKILTKDNRYYIRAASRSNNKTLRDHCHELVNFDIRDLDAFRKSASDVDYIIHLAAVFNHSESLRKEIVDTSVVGAENLLEIAKLKNLKKIIYTSSVAVCGISKFEQLLTEENVINSDEASLDPYIHAKKLSHDIIEDGIKKYKLPITILMPSIIIGPNDFRLTPSNSIIKKFLKFPFNLFYLSGGLNFINVRDVALAHLISIDKAEIGNKYIVSGHNIKIKELVKKINSLTNKKKIIFCLPKQLLILIYYLFKPFIYLFNIKFPLSQFQIKHRIGTFLYFNNKKFLDMSSIKLISLDDTLIETIDWLNS